MGIWFEPVSVLGLSINRLEDADYRKRERKKWLAEFTLNSSDVLPAGGIEIARNDIVAAFDLLDDREVREYLRVIHEDPVAYESLSSDNPPQQPDVVLGACRTLSQLPQYACHAHFVGVWERFVRSLVTDWWRRRADIGTFGAICRSLDAWPQPFRKAAFEDVTAELSMLKADLAKDAVAWNAGQRPQTGRNDDAERICGLVGALPSSFTEEKTALARAFRNLSVAIHNSDYADHEVSQRLLRLSVMAAKNTAVEKMLKSEEAELQQIRVDAASRKPAMDALEELADVAGTSPMTGGRSLPATHPFRDRLTRVISKCPALVSVLNEDCNDAATAKLRDGVAMCLRNLSVGAWNSGGMKDLAPTLLGFASQIRASAEIRARIEADRRSLQESTAQTTASASGCIGQIVALVVVAIVIGLVKECSRR